MAAQCPGQAVAASEKINRAGLAVILREDSAIATLFRCELVPRLRGSRDNLVPPELICVPLRQRGALVLVFHDRQFERQTLCVDQEVVGRKNGDCNWREVGTSCKQYDDDRRSEPRTNRAIER